MASADLRSAQVGWPLVGRREELDQVIKSLADPGGRGVLICGPAGVGKTRLAEEYLAVAAAHGRRIGRAVASRATAAVPLGAVVHLLPPRVLDGGLEPLGLFERVSSAIRRDPSRYVLSVDDLQLLDPTSLALITQLLAGDVLSLVATVRTGDLVPDAVSDLWLSGHTLRVDLAELSREAVDSLLYLALGGPVAQGTMSALWRASRGNVLFLRELVLGAQGGGNLVEQHGVWQLTGPLVGSDRLAELIDVRLRAVDERARASLELLALCEPVGVHDLLAVTDPALVEGLERSGLVSVQADGRRQAVLFVHPLYGEVLRGRLPQLARRRILLEQVDRVERTGRRRREDSLRIATWRLDAVGTADPDLLVRAAQLARNGHDFNTVAALSKAVLVQVESVDAQLLLGEALYELGEFAAAEQLLATAQRNARGESQLVQVVATRVRNMLWGLQRVTEALEINREAQERVSGRDARNELLADHATLLMFSGYPNEALAVIAALGDDTDLRTRVVRAIPESVALRMIGCSERALRVATQGFDDHLQLGDQLAIASPGSHLVNKVGALQDSGRLGEAVELATAGYDLATQYRSPIGRIWFCASKGYALQVSGLVRSAHACYSEAVALCREYRYLGHLRFIITGLAVTAALLGRAEEAVEAMAESDRLPSVGAFETADLGFGRAWAIVAASKELPRARQVLLAAADLARHTGHRMSELGLLHDVARLGDPAAVRGRVAELAELCEGVLVAAYGDHVRAASDHDGDALAQVSERFAQMGALLFAAEAATEASSAYSRSGQPRKATALRLRSDELVAQCEGARTPALVAGTGLVPLTRRESEIAQLAAAGQSSREIASRLHLSVRTVDNHLQNVYGKLGLPGRAELGTALGITPAQTATT